MLHCKLVVASRLFLGNQRSRQIVERGAELGACVQLTRLWPFHVRTTQQLFISILESALTRYLPVASATCRHSPGSKDSCCSVGILLIVLSRRVCAQAGSRGAASPFVVTAEDVASSGRMVSRVACPPPPPPQTWG